MTITMSIATGATDEERRQLVRDTLDPAIMPVPVGLRCDSEPKCPGHFFGPDDFPIHDLTCDDCGYLIVKWVEI